MVSIKKDEESGFDPLQRYVSYLEGFSPDSLDVLEDYCTSDMVFSDPFNLTRGRSAYRRILEKMYEDVPSISFVVTRSCGTCVSGYITWQFSGTTRQGNNISFEGVSELLFDAEGKVSSHRDFWDPAAGLYETLPVIGWLLRKIRRKLSAN